MLKNYSLLILLHTEGEMKKLLSILLALFVFIIIGCSEDKEEQPVTPDTALEKATCEGCHSNYAVLKAVYTPDPPSDGGAGCGGETPHIEPYDRVYLGGPGYEDFKNDIHGKLPCVSCHKGVDNTADKNIAHSGDFIKKPSADAALACGSCHPNIVNQAKNSIHEQGWGQKSMVTLRAGLGNVPDAFENLSDLMKQGYDKNCAKCHASCGDCHVMRPKAGGGGLYRAHKFIKTPDMVDHCTTCHTSRGGHAYFGVAPGTVPDVHLTKRGFTCMSCHKMDEIHGDGNIYDQRYKVAAMPECIDCHSGVSSSNVYHSTHINTFSCNTCHSQNYNNCGSCHIGGVGARVPAYLGYKIGLNPIKETKPGFKFTLLRRSLMAPDSWIEYGIPVLQNFDVRPTYKYATPHNIIKVTSRTGYKNESGEWVAYPTNSCRIACHIRKNSDGTFTNKELYLFESDLIEDWEKSASGNIVVDGKLPPSWGVN